MWKRGQMFKAAWSHIDESTDPGQFVQFMDAFRQERGDNARAYKGIFDLLAVKEGDCMLDVGCGTGGAVKALAPFVAPTGKVVGIDNSAAMIQACLKRVDGIGLPVEYRVADAHNMPFEASSFDGVYSEGTFQIIEDPERALAEMVRVARPGGRIVINGTDNDMVAIDSSDRDLTRRIIHFIADQETNGWIGRQLRGMYVRQGLVNITVEPWTWLTNDFRYVKRLWLDKWVGDAIDAGVATEDEVARWFAEMEERHQHDTFTFTFSGFRVKGEKP